MNQGSFDARTLDFIRRSMPAGDLKKAEDMGIFDLLKAQHKNVHKEKVWTPPSNGRAGYFSMRDKKNEEKEKPEKAKQDDPEKEKKGKPEKKGSLSALKKLNQKHAAEKKDKFTVVSPAKPKPGPEPEEKPQTAAKPKSEPKPAPKPVAENKPAPQPRPEAEKKPQPKEQPQSEPALTVADIAKKHFNGGNNGFYIYNLTQKEGTGNNKLSLNVSYNEKTGEVQFYCWNFTCNSPKGKTAAKNLLAKELSLKPIQKKAIKTMYAGGDAKADFTLKADDPLAVQYLTDYFSKISEPEPEEKPQNEPKSKPEPKPVAGKKPQPEETGDSVASRIVSLVSGSGKAQIVGSGLLVSLVQGDDALSATCDIAKGTVLFRSVCSCADSAQFLADAIGVDKAQIKPGMYSFTSEYTLSMDDPGTLALMQKYLTAPEGEKPGQGRRVEPLRLAEATLGERIQNRIDQTLQEKFEKGEDGRLHAKGVLHNYYANLDVCYDEDTGSFTFTADIKPQFLSDGLSKENLIRSMLMTEAPEHKELFQGNKAAGEDNRHLTISRDNPYMSHIMQVAFPKYEKMDILEVYNEEGAMGVADALGEELVAKRFGYDMARWERLYGGSDMYSPSACAAAMEMWTQGKLYDPETEGMSKSELADWYDKKHLESPFAHTDGHTWACSLMRMQQNAEGIDPGSRNLVKAAVADRILNDIVERKEEVQDIRLCRGIALDISQEELLEMDTISLGGISSFTSEAHIAHNFAINSPLVGWEYRKNKRALKIVLTFDGEDEIPSYGVRESMYSNEKEYLVRDTGEFRINKVTVGLPGGKQLSPGEPTDFSRELLYVHISPEN